MPWAVLSVSRCHNKRSSPHYRCQPTHYTKVQPTHYAHHMDDPTTAIQTARAHKNPTERARALGKLLATQLPALTSQLRAERQAAVLAMRAENMSWAEIGAAIGQHRNRAQQIGEGRSGGRAKKPPAATD